MGIPREHPPDERAAYHPDPYRNQILMEQVRQIYALAPTGFAATIMNSLLVFFIMRDGMRYSLLVPWIAAVSIITILRAWGAARFRMAKLTPDTAEVWANRFLSGLVAIGAAWGSIGLLPFSDISLAHQVFIAFVLGGMAAGASSTFAAVEHAFAAFTLPALVPLAVHFFLMNDSFHYAMAAMTALFGLLLWRISRHNYAVNRMSLLLRFENREIIESLQRAKEAVEGLNAQLRAEIEAKLSAEAELRSHQQQLERVVEQRTADLVAANEHLAAAKEAAEAASQAKSAFVANMSHEMRTPLAGALGMIKLVLEMEIGDEERRLLEMAKRSAESLLRIIADVLDFSRLEAGMMSFEEEVFSIADVVKTAVEVVSLHALEKGLRLSWTVDDSVPEQVKGDDGRLRQVLVNLLGNAVKFTEHGQVEVTVRLFADPAEAWRRFILFSIRDTGEGIPAEQIEMIFGKFTQIDSSLTKRHGGTGLGLALTREIVEKMGGRIWAESTVGIGSTFHFTLPVAEDGASE